MRGRQKVSPFDCPMQGTYQHRRGTPQSSSRWNLEALVKSTGAHPQHTCTHACTQACAHVCKQAATITQLLQWGVHLLEALTCVQDRVLREGNAARLGQQARHGHTLHAARRVCLSTICRHVSLDVLTLCCQSSQA